MHTNAVVDLSDDKSRRESRIKNVTTSRVCRDTIFSEIITLVILSKWNYFSNFE